MAATAGASASTPNPRQRVGIALAGLYSLANVPSVLFPTPDGATGPPLAILVIDTALGVVGVVGAALAWRGSRTWLRVAAGAVVLITLSGLPAFFVDVSTTIATLVGVSFLLTVLVVALMFSGDGREENLE